MAATREGMESREGAGRRLERVGGRILRYGLVIILLWVGLLKFTAYEAEGIKPLVSNSPLMSWGLQVMSLRTFSSLIGIFEITMGVLIATRRFAPKTSAIGSLGAVVIFLTTLSFVLTTPGVWEPGYGFPFPSSKPGQFFVKRLDTARSGCLDRWRSLPRYPPSRATALI